MPARPETAAAVITRHRAAVPAGPGGCCRTAAMAGHLRTRGRQTPPCAALSHAARPAVLQRGLPAAGRTGVVRAAHQPLCSKDSDHMLMHSSYSEMAVLCPDDVAESIHPPPVASDRRMDHLANHSQRAGQAWVAAPPPPSPMITKALAWMPCCTEACKTFILIFILKYGVLLRVWLDHSLPRELVRD